MLSNIKMPLATKYVFDISQVNDEVVITLTQLLSSRTKIFKQRAGMPGRLKEHMLSLTDVQCDDWFKPLKKEHPRLQLLSAEHR